MKEILVKFKNNGIWYYVEIRNSRLVYYSIVDDVVNYHLTEEEIQLIDFVVDRITPAKNLYLTISITKSNDRYNVFYDRKTGLRFVISNNTGNIITDMMYLLNNREEYFCKYRDLVQNPEPGFFKWTIKNGASYIIAMVGVLALTLVAFKTIDYDTITEKNNYYSIAYQSIEESISRPTTEIQKELEEALDRNEILTVEEKELIRGLLGTVCLNNQYYDINMIKQRLETLSIYYNPEEKEDFLGTYTPSSNTINFYRVNCLEEVSNANFCHEVSHMFQKYDDYSYNSFLIETSNVIYNCENNDCNDSAYFYSIPYAKALMEIIGSEPFLKIHGFNSEQIIIDALKEIIDDEDLAVSLVSNLEEHKKICEGKYADVDADFYNELKLKIETTIRNYYNTKYNRPMTNDLVMLFYLDRPTFYNTLLASIDMPTRDYVITEITCLINYFNDLDNDVLFVIKAKNGDGNSVYFNITKEGRYLINMRIDKSGIHMETEKNIIGIQNIGNSTFTKK